MATLIVPDVLPTPAQDSETLRKAFQDKKLWGTAEKEVKVISVLGHRNANQRRKIRETYHELYNESLIDRLRYELKNVSLFDAFVRSEYDFWNAILLWTMDPPERDAELANKALKKEQKGVDHLQVIIEIACASSPHHLMAVRQAYCSSFDCSLEEHITSNVTLPLRKLLLGLVSSYRYDGELVDANIAASEASVLHDAIKKKQLDCNDVVWILSTRNIFQLKETFEYYKQKYGNPIEQDIKSSGTSDLESSILIMVICCIETPEKHFAEVVRKSVHRIGTDEDSLTRAIVSRAEIDMMKIRGEYFNMYKTSLDKEVIGDTSGDYQHFLVTLLGGKL